MSAIIINSFVNTDDLFKHEKEVCKDVRCSDCPFYDGTFCAWRKFINKLPSYRAEMRSEE